MQICTGADKEPLYGIHNNKIAPVPIALLFDTIGVPIQYFFWIRACGS